MSFSWAASSVLLRLGLGRYHAQKQFLEFVTAYRKQQNLGPTFQHREKQDARTMNIRD